MNKRLPILAGLCTILALMTVAEHSREPTSREIDYTLPPRSQITQFIIERPQTAALQIDCSVKVCTIGKLARTLDQSSSKLLDRTFKDAITMDLELQNVDDLGQYGLTDYAIRVTISASKKKTFRIGKVVNDRFTFIYDEDDKRVFRARANLRQLFDRTELKWRKTTLFEDEYRDVLGVEFYENQRLIWASERETPEQAWRMLKPGGLEAGQDEIAAVVNSMVQAKAMNFDDSSAKLARVRRLTFKTADAREYGLFLGESKADGSLPVQRFEMLSDTMKVDDFIAVLPRHQAIFLQPRPQDLINRRLFDFDASDVLAVVWQGQSDLRLEKQQDKWRIVWADKTKTISQDQADSFRERLAKVKAIKVFSNQRSIQLGATVQTINIELVGGRRVICKIGDAFGQGRLVRSDRPNAPIMAFSKSALDVLTPDVSDLFR